MSGDLARSPAQFWVPFARIDCRSQQWVTLRFIPYLPMLRDSVAWQTYWLVRVRLDRKSSLGPAGRGTSTTLREEHRSLRQNTSGVISIG